MSDSLQASEQAAAAVATHPRVTLAEIEAAIAARFDATGDEVANINTFDRHYAQLHVLSICLLVMKNGFTVIGKSAPAAPENFNPALGRRFAYEDAVRQLWPLMGYALRDRLRAQDAG